MLESWKPQHTYTVWEAVTGMTIHDDDVTSKSDTDTAPVAWSAVTDDITHELRVNHSVHEQIRTKVSSSLKRTLLIISICVVLVVIVNMFMIRTYQIPSGSMEPTLVEGDFIMAFPLFNKPEDVQRGDIVVFATPESWNEGNDVNKIYVKRAVALGGDTVECCSTGQLMVNGYPVNEFYIEDMDEPSKVDFEYTVPADEMFVLGDNRSMSLDSRYHPEDPFIPVSSVLGRPKVLVWPFQRVEGLPDAGTTFSAVPEP